MLFDICAIDDSLQVTDLGMALSKYPVAPRHAKMLLLANSDGGGHNVLQYALSIVAGLSATGRPFVLSKEEEQHSSPWRNAQSDMLGILRAVGAYAFTDDKGNFCSANQLNHRAMREIQLIKGQLERLLRRRGLLQQGTSAPPPPSPVQERLLRQIITASMLDKVARLAPAGTFSLVRKGEGAPPADSVEGRRFRQRRARQLRYAYETSERGLSMAMKPLYIHSKSFVYQKNIQRLPQFVVYQDAIEIDVEVEDSEDGSVRIEKKVLMRGVTAIEANVLYNLCKGTGSRFLVCPAPQAQDAKPSYDQARDCITCICRPLFGPHKWQLPAQVVPLRDTMGGPESEARWFVRLLLEGTMRKSFKALTATFKLSPSILTVSRFNAVGLKLINAVRRLGIVSLTSLRTVWLENPHALQPELRMWVAPSKYAEFQAAWARVQKQICRE